MKPLLLRKSEAVGQIIQLWMEYDPSCSMDPETMLIEKDLLAPLFDSTAHPTYRVQSGRIDAVFDSFTDALDRYMALVRNWNAKETFKHPKIFRWIE